MLMATLDLSENSRNSCSIKINNICIIICRYYLQSLFVDKTLFPFSQHKVKCSIGSRQSVPLKFPGCLSVISTRHTSFRLLYGNACSNVFAPLIILFVICHSFIGSQTVQMSLDIRNMFLPYTGPSSHSAFLWSLHGSRYLRSLTRPLQTRLVQFPLSKSPEV